MVIQVKGIKVYSEADGLYTLTAPSGEYEDSNGKRSVRVYGNAVADSAGPAVGSVYTIEFNLKGATHKVKGLKCVAGPPVNEAYRFEM